MTIKYKIDKVTIYIKQMDSGIYKIYSDFKEAIFSKEIYTELILQYIA